MGLDKTHLKDFHRDKLEHSDCQVKTQLPQHFFPQIIKKVSIFQALFN